MGKAVKSVTKAASSAVSSIANGVGKVVSGDVSEGLGDIGQAAARVGLDTVTVGNKDKADALSGGLLTAAEGAARGNSEDIARVGATVAATAYGGPMGAMAVNSAFAAGGSVLDAGVSYLGGTGNTGLANVANMAKNLIEPPKSKAVAPPPSEAWYDFAAPTSGRSNTGIYIAVGVAVITLVLILIIKRRR